MLRLATALGATLFVLGLVLSHFLDADWVEDVSDPLRAVGLLLLALAGFAALWVWAL